MCIFLPGTIQVAVKIVVNLNAIPMGNTGIYLPVCGLNVTLPIFDKGKQ